MWQDTDVIERYALVRLRLVDRPKSLYVPVHSRKLHMQLLLCRDTTCLANSAREELCFVRREGFEAVFPDDRRFEN